MKEKTQFILNKNKCLKCYNCINVCSGMVLKVGNDNYPYMKDFERFGWRGCWRCQHCIAVCPTGAISIFGLKASDLPKLPSEHIRDDFSNLIASRRSCRRYLKQNVDKDIINNMIKALANVPTGGNTCGVEYTIIDDLNRVKQIRDVAYNKMEQLAKNKHYTHSFSEFYYKIMKESENSVRKDDLLFCGAPHLFIAHQKCSGKWAEDAKVDCNIATAYFELLANSYNLGTVIMSYPSEVIEELAREVKSMLGIPDDHYMGLIVGFGYKEIEYHRGIQKNRSSKVYLYTKNIKEK